jgi:2-haloacid dehalogenase
MAANNNQDHRQAMIFDVGGVLLDWNPRHLYRKFFNGDHEGMERFLREIDFNGWNLRQDAGRPFSEAVAALTAQHPQWAELIQAYNSRWEESILGPIEGSVEILADLREIGYPLYALSNFSIEKFQLVQNRYDFFSWFDHILLSAQVQLAKPDPKIFKVFLEQIEREPDQCLLIDDSSPNIETARQLGFDVIHFQSAGQLRSELNQRGIL